MGRATGMWPTRATTGCAKVQPGGNLFTVAGNGNASYFGDGGPATQASVNQPEGVAVDAAGNVYIADTLDNVVRKVTADGMISTLAGTGTPGYSGDGGPATTGALEIAARGGGGCERATSTWRTRATIADPAHSTAQGTITTVDTGGALNDPRGVAVDRAGNLYIADTGQPAGAQRVAGHGDDDDRGQRLVLLLRRRRAGAGRAVEPAVGPGGGCQRQHLCGGRGKQRDARAVAGIGGHFGERGDECGEQSGGSGRAR